MDFRYERLPIFCYLCGKIDHDEKDCLQWIRSKDTLRLEEKQFGPWSRASQDKNQKSQLATAEKNGETRSVVGVKKNMERRMDGQVVSTQARTSSYENHLDETVRTMISRADVEERIDTPCHVCIKNPDITQVPSFEQ